MSYLVSYLRRTGSFAKGNNIASVVHASEGFVAFKQVTAKGLPLPEFDWELEESSGILQIKDDAGLSKMPSIGDPDVIVLPLGSSFFDSVRQDAADDISSGFQMCSVCSSAGYTVDTVHQSCDVCKNNHNILEQLAAIQPAG